MSSGKSRKVFIITGMSGAGKSQALKSFEDLGFYCVDNLPLALLPSFAKLIHKRADLGDIALGIDIREGKTLRGISELLNTLKKDGLDFQIIFFDASDNILVHRFSETRHRHPLGKNLLQAIRQERRMLTELKELTHKEIDTSSMTLGELKETLSRLLGLRRSKEMKLSVISFGYKYGLPIDADLVIDARFISNPNYIPALKKKTGLDKPVAEYILRDSHAKVFLKKLLDLVRYLIPLYMKEGKSYLTIAIGCTGGRHRSVFFSRQVANALRADGMSVAEFHKDMRKQ